jgi:type IV secretion system protein VirB10
MYDDIAATHLEADRGAPAVQSSPSLRARLTNALAIGLIVFVGAAFLFYWYAGFATRERTARSEAAKLQARSGGDMNLPALGIFDVPHAGVAPLSAASPPPLSPSGVMGLGASPRHEWGGGHVAPQLPIIAPVRVNDLAPGSSGWRRRLASPVLWRNEAGATVHGRHISTTDGASADAAARPDGSAMHSPAATAVAVVSAQVVPTRRLLLPKGSGIDCTLETAIDSQLPGLATCLTAVDVFGADGSVVLLERGTQLIGEVRSDVRPGQSRVFVLWNEARTPAGIIVSLASPATDPLGRAGIQGDDDRHFAERFGAALLISVIDGAIQAATTSRGSGSAVVVNPDASQTILTEILRSTIAIPPTIRVPHGTRVAVLVARDVDFRSVYTLSAIR